MLRFIFAILISVFLCQSISLAGIGSSTGADYLKMYGGARPLALGEAYTALGDDVSSLLINPAGLAQINQPQLLSMYNQWFGGINQRLALFAMPTKAGVLAIGYSLLDSGDIQGYDNSGTMASVFSTSASSINIGIANKFRENFFWGLSVKSINERLENVSASTYAVDGGIKYILNPKLSVGASVLNLGPGLRFISETTSLPLTARAGASYATKLFDKYLNIGTDLVYYADGTKICIGAEYFIHDILVLRGGSYGNSLRGGVGINVDFLSIDYAYSPHVDLGATHQVSVSIKFGSQDPIKKTIMENIALGNAYYKSENYSDAILKYQKALDLDPLNEEARLGFDKSQREMENSFLTMIVQERKTERKDEIRRLMNAGKDQLKLGKYIEALIAFSEVLKIDQSNMEALRLSDQARAGLAERISNKLKLDSKEDTAQAIKLVTLGQYSEAKNMLQQALGKDPSNTTARDLLRKISIIEKLK
ncbi:MAG: PorV/PorQ family protein [Candidatus Margulisiibacteriota bacterium]